MKLFGKDKPAEMVARVLPSSVQALSVQEMLEEMAQRGFPAVFKSDVMDGKWHCDFHTAHMGAKITVDGEWTPVLYDAVATCYAKVRRITG